MGLSRIPPHVVTLGGMAISSLGTLALMPVLTPAILPAYDSAASLTLKTLGNLLIWSACVLIPATFAYMLRAGRPTESPLTFPRLTVWLALLLWWFGLTALVDAFETLWQVHWTSGVVKVAAGAAAWVFIGSMLRQRKQLMLVWRVMRRAFEEGEQG